MNRPIVTLTLNPALDLSSKVDVVAPMHKLRCESPVAEPGGGGINVSRVCQRLGAPTVAIAAVAGSIGQRFGRLLEDESIPFVPLLTDGETRESVTINETSTGQQYRFVFPGPAIGQREVAQAGRLMADIGAESSVAVISGSMPDLPAGSIPDLVSALPNAQVVVDTSGPALVDSLGSSAALVKPSARELAGVIGRTLGDERAIAIAANEILAESSVGALLVSIGSGGAFLCTRDDVIRFRAPSVQVRSAVGAGDSLVAGIAVGLSRDQPLADAVALGIAAGSAAVMSEGTQLCRPDDVEALLPLVESR